MAETDTKITISIPYANRTETMTGFLSLFPNDEKDEKDEPKYTNYEWLERKVRDNFLAVVERGKRKAATLAAQQITVADDLVDVTVIPGS